MMRRVQHFPTHFPHAFDSTHKMLLMVLFPKALDAIEGELNPVEKFSGEESTQYLAAMIRRSCSSSGFPCSVPSEEPSKAGPVHDDAVELQREASPVRNQCSSTTPEEKMVKGPVSVDTSGEDCGRERLKRHRVDVAGRCWVPDIWGQEDFLKDWIDCSAFDSSLFPTGITSARKALMEEGRRANAGGLQIENRC